MNVIVLLAGCAGMAFSVYAWARPHFPNGAALGAILQAARLLSCRHDAGAWRITRLRGRVYFDCRSCAAGRRAMPPLGLPKEV